MSLTPRLQLPCLAAGQAQKHVTLNEALLRLDALVQISILSRTIASPPASNTAGHCYIVPANATGIWAGHSGKLARFQDGAWEMITPGDGWLAWLASEESFVLYRNGSWSAVSMSGEQAPRWGVNTAADNANRLAVASPGSLFTHEGSSHRLNVNKAAAGHTGSVVFLTAYDGKAEIGLSGDDDLHVKVNDGTWREALTIKQNGITLMPNQPIFATQGGISTTPAYGLNKIIWASTFFNVRSCYNSANGRFTALSEGKYHLSVSLLTDYTNATFNLYLFKNGSSIGRIFFLNSIAANEQRILNNSLYVSLAAGDYIEVLSDQAAFWPWNEPMSQFSGRLIG